MDPVARRTGAETKQEAQRIALELFSLRGYQATSMREIAERVGISKAALYYHFAGKGDIVLAVTAERGAEVAELLHWVREQPRDADLPERAVLRWIGEGGEDKLRGIRFSLANPTLIGGEGSRAIGGGLEAVAAELAGDGASPTRTLLIRMALLSLNAAVAAARGTALDDAQLVAGAREAALALLREAG